MAVTTTDKVQAISMSEEERRSGKYSLETLGKALEAMHQDGLVVLKNVIDVDIIQSLNEKMCADAEKKLADPTQTYNHGVKSNFLQRPPVTDTEYLHKDVYFNSFLLQLANAYLGHKPVWNWLTSNTALANTKGMRQLSHKDGSFAHPLYPYYFIANIPLCDFTAENGATEFWLGSHAQATWRDQQLATETGMAQYPVCRKGEPIPPITEEAKAARMKIRPPIQPQCCQGDIMIRDLRLWHAGMPNESDKHRIMLGLGYASPVFPNYTMRVHLPFAQQNFFLGNAGDMVDVRAQFYSDEEYAETKNDMIFNLRPTYLE